MSKCEPVETESPFYYSLLGAVNRFGIATNEIIDLAIKGEIILSVKVPKEYTPYLMSIIEPEELKRLGFLMYAKNELEGISMLPLKVDVTYLNLSRADCKVLKTSILEQSVFESAFCEPYHSNSEHILVHSNDDWVCNVKLGLDKARLEELQDNDFLTQQAEIINNLPPIIRDRFVNGVRGLQSINSKKPKDLNDRMDLIDSKEPEDYLRRFVIIDKYLAREVDEDLEFDQGVEFLAGSYLNQTFTKELTITLSDIAISSNYKNVLKFTTTIPESSPYFVKPELRDFNGLHALAEIGYKYFIVEEKSHVEPLKTILSAQVKSKKTIDAAVFFLNPKPHHSAGLHKSTLLKSSKCQFQYLLKESEKYWCDKDLCSPSDIDKFRRCFAEELHHVGFSDEKAIHGEFLSLPNSLKVNEGVRILSISKVFPKV